MELCSCVFIFVKSAGAGKKCKNSVCSRCESFFKQSPRYVSVSSGRGRTGDNKQNETGEVKGKKRNNVYRYRYVSIYVYSLHPLQHIMHFFHNLLTYLVKCACAYVCVRVATFLSSSMGRKIRRVFCLFTLFIFIFVFRGIF